MTYHIPVMKEQVVAALGLTPGAVVIDGTVGDGGHAEAIFQAVNGNATLIGFDLDPVAISLATGRLASWKQHTILVNDSYTTMPAVCAARGLRPSAILLDLGIRSAEIEESGRGFSFRKDEPLNMRFDGRTDGETAATIVNGATEAELTALIREYGEERFARQIARAIVAARKHARLLTTGQLVAVIHDAIPASARHQPVHFATRTFQALRIATNQELDAVAAVIPAAIALLAPKGRLVMISFHSLEDRLVKHGMKRAATAGLGTLVTKKPLLPTDDECAQNPRARSAKVRVFQKEV